MGASLLRWMVLVVALAPLAYYVIAIYCEWDYFRGIRHTKPERSEFTPPASVLKPVRGVDDEAYGNFASFCRLDYPQYEILFAVADADDPVLPILKKLQSDFPERNIRV